MHGQRWRRDRPWLLATASKHTRDERIAHAASLTIKIKQGAGGVSSGQCLTLRFNQKETRHQTLVPWRTEE